MPNYGFAIDLRKCIGCHACTIACKAEHEIPVGVNRCWVKTVEKGTFPDTRRFFFPVLCNQCDRAPCEKICPTNALFKRDDGIVDLHGDSCIGCRACMVACPYDQLFIDPNTRTAEKCNFCANRVENELLPACVSVCPTECRIFGDLDDPASEVAQIAEREAVSVRKPEKGTIPKVFYIGAEESAIQPEIAARPFIYKEGRVRLLCTHFGFLPGKSGFQIKSQADRRDPWLLAPGSDGRDPVVAGRSLGDHPSCRPGDLARVHDRYRRAAHRRSRAARALLLHPPAAELAVVDGVGRVLPDGARRHRGAVDRRRLVGSRGRADRARLACRHRLDSGDLLYRLPVRPGPGARPVAGTPRDV